MALLSFTSRFTPLVLSEKIPKPLSFCCIHFPTITRSPTFPSLRFKSSASAATPDPVAGGEDAGKPSESPAKISDEWGEDYEWDEDGTEAEADADAEAEYIDKGNASPVESRGEEGVDDELQGLKRALVDTLYGTELGFRAGSDVRAEVTELVAQLEAANPNSAPVEEPALLDGNWVLLYTASSELLPLLAAGTTPLLKVDKISQTIDTSSFTLTNSTTLSSPLAYLSFSASASFEVRSPTRIQVIFKEGTLQPPEIKSRIELPENADIFGQKLSLLPLQQSLGPLQDVVASISRAISGLPPLKIPIPGERTSSWLITTYLDEDLRISRGDGGLFILAREGTPLLDQ